MDTIITCRECGSHEMARHAVKVSDDTTTTEVTPFGLRTYYRMPRADRVTIKFQCLDCGVASDLAVTPTGHGHQIAWSNKS